MTLIYEAPRDPNEEIRVRGVGRVADEPRAILIALTERPTDDEIRSLHEYLRFWNPNSAMAGYSCNGINLWGDKKSIDAAFEAFHSHSQIGDLKRDLRHWRDEVGKLRSKPVAFEHGPNCGCHYCT
jgi:hypothetical protein